MSNEFVARNGLLALDNSSISGSLNITGSITASGDIVPKTNGTGNVGTNSLRFSNIWANQVYGASVLVNTIKDDGVSPITFANLGNSISVARLYTSTTGNLLLRSSSAATYSDNGYKLQIYSEAQNTGSLYITGSSSHTLLRIDSPVSSSILFVTGSGNVGFGTTTPTQKITVGSVDSDGILINVGGKLYLRDTVTYINEGSGLNLVSGATRNIKFNAGGSDRMFISASGNVGIGTSNPSYSLDVSGSTFSRKLVVGSDAGFTGGVTQSDYFQRSTSGGTVFLVRDVNNNTIFAAAGASSTSLFYSQAQNIGLGASAPTAKVQVTGNGTTSATTAFLIQNVTPTNLMTVLDNGQFTISSPLISLAASQSAYVISQSISASNAVGGNYYAVNITPTFYQTTASQTETAFRVAATFTQSSVLATGGTNIIADFGATSVGSQLTVTDITSGSIYMVNDVSGLPIIEATSDWTVNMYNFPSIVLQKTGSQVNINGTLRVSGSFILPLSQSTTPLTGSAYWSGSLLFIWDGTRYRSSSFA